MANDIPFTVHNVKGRYGLRSMLETNGSAIWVILDDPEPILNYRTKYGYCPIHFDTVDEYIDTIKGLKI